MKLILDREYLKPEFQDINCSQTRLEHFKPEVQAVVIQVGRARFLEYDGSNYNAILVPEKLTAES